MVFIRAHPRHPWLDSRARRHRRPSLRGRSFWAGEIRDDENHAAEPDATANRRPPWSWVPWSLWHSPLEPRRSLSFALVQNAMPCNCANYQPIELDRESISRRIKQSPQIRKRLTQIAEHTDLRLYLFRCPECGQ